MTNQDASDTIAYWVEMQDDKTLANHHRMLRAKSSYAIDAAERELLQAIGAELDKRNWRRET
jgi:hypothetical protein